MGVRRSFGCTLLAFLINHVVLRSGFFGNELMFAIDFGLLAFLCALVSEIILQFMWSRRSNFPGHRLQNCWEFVQYKAAILAQSHAVSQDEMDIE